MFFCIIRIYYPVAERYSNNLFLQLKISSVYMINNSEALANNGLKLIAALFLIVNSAQNRDELRYIDTVKNQFT